MYRRRDLLKGALMVGGCGLFTPRRAAAEPPPETTRLRVFEGPIICIAPQYVAEDLLHAEGFTDVRYVRFPADTRAWAPEVLASGEVDFTLSFVPTDVVRIDEGAPFTILAGSHIGCTELIGSNRIGSVRELQGKAIAVSRLGSDSHIFISMFVAHVGLDPRKDIRWIIRPTVETHPELLEAGAIDAFMAGPPLSIEYRAKRIGHVLVNTTTDKPWSQHFCCLITANTDFVRKYPAATKRALRAILKAGDLCAREPAQVARLIAAKGLGRYDTALQTMKELPYGRWREYDAEGSIRFFALRLRDVGMIKSGPQKILAQAADWRFLNELKRELKG
jgi:NitT/TauT family transport system substrate-binding protein